MHGVGVQGVGMLPLGAVSGGGGPTYDADASTLFAAMSVQPDVTRKVLISDTYATLKTAGIYTKLDECWFLAAHTLEAALLGWKRKKDITAVGGPIFTAHQGIAGDGAASYLDTNFVPSVDGVQYTQNDASFGLHSRTNTNSNTIDFGVRNNSSSRYAYCLSRNSGSVNYPINTSNVPTAAVPASTGLFAIRRTGSTASAVFRNGVSVGTSAAVSSAIATRPLYACCVNSVGVADFFSARQLSFLFVGASLSDQEMTDLYTIVQGYQEAVDIDALAADPVLSLATGQIIFDGNSMTAAAYSSYPGTVMASFPNMTSKNYAVSGQTTQAMNADAVGQIDSQYNGGLANNVLVCWEGTNDLYFGATATNAYNALVTYCTGRRSAGFKVVVVTILPRSGSGTPGTFEADRQTINTSIRANWATFADALADVTTSTLIGDAGDSTNHSYYSDGTHMTTLGYDVVAGIVAAAIDTLA